MRAPPGTVCQLLRSFYGLKQAPRNWNAHLHEFLVSSCFERSAYDSCLYTRMYRGYVVVLAVFVDDVLIACANTHIITEIKRCLKITTQ